MINEPALQDVLVSLSEHSKMQLGLILSLLNEVAALRETVRHLDPTFSDALHERRKQVAAQANTENVRTAIQLHDELVLRVKSGTVFY